ncbi:MAG: hypothetical protein OHK0013_35900 [Sandaracinaceae bacterium]
MGLLPQRTLALAPGFVVARLAVALVPSLALGALGIGGIGLAAADVARLLSQDAIVAEGVAAAHPRVDIVRDASWMMFRARRYEVSFQDARGDTHTHTLREHDLSIPVLVVEGPPEVHYDPRDPSRIAVGFARQNVRAQWAAVALLSTVGALAIAAALALLLRLSRPLLAAWRSTGAREEKVARVLSARPFHDASGAPTGALELELSIDSGECLGTWGYRQAAPVPHRRATPDRTFVLVTAPHDPPIYLDASERSTLVVVGEGAAPVVVRRSGHPFVLSAEERAELDARVEAMRRTRHAVA